MTIETGILLCGTTATHGSPNILADVVALNNLGGVRASVSNRKASSAGHFAKKLFSCIAEGLPLNLTVVFSPQVDWAAALLASASNLVLTWALEEGAGTHGTVTWKMGLVRYAVSGELDGRCMAEITLDPSGDPTIVAETA